MSLKNATKKENNRVELEIEVDAATFNAAVNAAYKKDIKNMNIPGFRRGKAPRAFVEKMYGTGVFYETAVNDVYPAALDEAIKASGYEYVEDKIDFDVTSVGEDGLKFTAVITVKPEVKLGEYKGLKATRTLTPVTDADVDAEIDRLRERNARMISVEDRAAAMGDTVTFDFEGFVDGEAFEGGKAENHALLLGSGQFIPGFEEQLVGKKVDEDCEVNVTFPEEYHAKELAGKPAVFRCKIHEIQTKELPELGDDFAKDVSDFDTLDELKADARKKQEEQRAAAADETVSAQLVDALIGILDADIPEAMFVNAVNDAVRDFDYRLQSQGLNMEMYMKYTGMDMDAFRANFREQAEKQVKMRLILEEIAKLENIVPTEEDLEKEYTRYAEMYQMEADKVKAFIPASELSKDIAVEKAMDLVKEAAVITDKKAEDKPKAAKKPAAKSTKSTTTKAKTADGEKKPAAKKTTKKAQSEEK